MKKLYYTTVSDARIVEAFWYYNDEVYGNLVYDDGTDIRDYVGEKEEVAPPPEPPQTKEALLVSHNDMYIVTSSNMKIALTI